MDSQIPQHTIFPFSGGVNVRAREGWEFHKGNRYNFLRAVEGEGAWSDKNSQSSGVVRLSGSQSHWSILKASADRDSGQCEVRLGRATAQGHSELHAVLQLGLTAFIHELPCTCSL